MLRLTSGSASARKHYRRDNLTDDAVGYAVEHILYSWALDDADDPRCWMMIRC
ncbi:hypothetical protein PA05_1719 [Cutibacterium acnes P05]|nr:hypothetical protein HMPREF9608_00239 [Cutibacterium acnes HL067PA1]MCW5114367.1 hypothetical protein [Cutibacterium acnes P05]